MDPRGAAEVTRRLAAILIADVVGYTRLMERDDTGTFARLRTIRAEVVDPAILSHGGRIVKTAGDGLLAEFQSALSALRASVQIQREMATRNGGIAADDRIEYRIGVNLGDVMVEGTDIAGDGVNVASRLESLAAPGGICVSSAAREQVHGQLDVDFIDIGEQQVKNITRPIRVYRVSLVDAHAAKPAKPRAPRLVPALRRSWVVVGVALVVVVGIGVAVWRQQVPTAPSAAPPLSIAIIPFSAPGGAPADEQFADALGSDVANGLGRARDLRVASYGAAASWKGKPVDARSVGRELNVRYVVEGDLRRSGDRLIVSARLVDASAAVQAWSERIELVPGQSSDDEATLSRRLVASLRFALYSAEERRAGKAKGEGASAMELVARANTYYSTPTLENAREAGRLLDAALQAEPNLVAALNARVLNLFYELEVDTHADRDRIVKKMVDLSARAVGIDYDDAMAWSYRALALAFDGRLDQALAANDRALKLDPNRESILVWRAWLKVLQGRSEEALAILQEVRTLFPGDNPLAVRMACMANFYRGRDDDAIALCERAAGLDAWYWDQVMLAAAHAHKGEMGKAAAAKEHLDKLLPGFSIALLKSRRYSIEPAFVQQAEARLYPNLRKAGVPEQ